MFLKLREFWGNLRRYHISFFNIWKKDSRYYIIFRMPPGAGFFSNYMYVLAHIQYAVEHGYKPVIDMENYSTLYNEEGEWRGTKNAWEYYFEQPGMESLDKAYNSKNYIVAEQIYHREYMPYSEKNDSYEIESGKMDVISKTLADYIHLKEDISINLESKWDKVSNGQVVLGVHYRGTDKKVEHENHYLSPDLERFFFTIDKCLSEHPEITTIFLCTDEYSVIELFEKKYSNVAYNECYRATDGSTTGIHNEINNEKGHKYQLGVEVLYDAYMLSKCDYLVYSHSNVINAAIIICNDNYKGKYFVSIS